MCAWDTGPSGLWGEVAASQCIPYLTVLSFLPSLPPDQFCISFQHRQDPHDKTPSIHDIGDNPVQVNDGCLNAPRAEARHLGWALQTLTGLSQGACSAPE